MAMPKLRFKEFSGDWASKKIIELADYVDYRGKTPKKTDNGILLITAKNIKQGYLDYNASQEYIDVGEFNEVMRRGKVQINDVLITTEAPLGHVASVDRVDIALAQRVIKYRGKKEILDNLFLKHRLLSNSFQLILHSKATGGTVQGIKGSTLHNIDTYFPSEIKEQTKIANFLSAVDEKIAQLSQKVELLTQYKQGMMQKLFSQQIRFKADDGAEFPEWDCKFLSEIGSFKNGLNKDKESFGRGIPFVNLMDVFGKQIVETDKLGLVDANKKEIKNYDLKTGDVLFIRSSVKAEGVGLTAIIDSDLRNTVYSGFLIRLRENVGLNLNFKKYCFMHDSFRNQLLAKSTTSANTNINQESLSTLTIEIPCLAEQTKIANFLTSIDQKIDLAQQQLKHAKQWKKGVLQQMFV